MKRLLFILISLLFISAKSYNQADVKGQVKAADSLIHRIIGNNNQKFILQIVPYKNSKKDYFEIDAYKNKIRLKGTNGVALASAFNYYLKYFLNGQVSWNSRRLNLPAKFPLPKNKIKKETLYALRYYLNYCTYNYSMSWWDWERWEQEIDWMAMNGINMPLSILGQNEILYRVFKQTGLNDEDLASFFPGPAYYAWFWMNNLDGWGGPLRRNLMKKQAVLQQKILHRQRSLGMKPVIASFTGHVPDKFTQRYPSSKYKTYSWSGFPKVKVLDPADSMFTVIGKLFLQEQTKLYGTDHYYSADVFNEINPPSHDSLFIDAMGKSVYRSMSSVDPDAVWVMQGWLFHYAKDFWKEAEIKSLLNAVPGNKMLILDLYTEAFPVWNRTEAYYGKPWIWNMLHNFGGKNGLYGDLNVIAKQPLTDFKNPLSKNMKGIGLSMEAIEQNPIVYELMTENIWEQQPIVLERWIANYVSRRYGASNPEIVKAWLNLKNIVYSNKEAPGGLYSPLQSRSDFYVKIFTDTNWYNPKDFIHVWKAFIQQSAHFKNAAGFQYDLADITRQVLSNYSFRLYEKIYTAYIKKDVPAFQQSAKNFLEVMDDMDEVLGSRKDFLLGKWLEDAKRLGTTREEKLLYEKNARNLITTWGNKNSELHDYSRRQWNGLMKYFYKPRWQQFLKEAENSLLNHITLDKEKVHADLQDWEWNWINSHEIYPSQPVGNAVTIANKIFYKYYNTILND